VGHIKWTLPVPSTALLGGGPVFRKRPGREIAIEYAYEDDDGERQETLVFQGVEAFRCRYRTALGRECVEAYDTLDDRGSTPWLDEIRGDVSMHGENATGLMHLMITFDGGPCYEFVCRGFRIDRRGGGR
jgi:hypothetical protein